MGNAKITGGEEFLTEWFGEGQYVTAHTSGSTGTPKEIQLSKAAMRQSARATNTFFGIGPESVMVCPLSEQYIAGKMMIVRALEADCRLLMLRAHSNPLAELPTGWLPIDLLPIVPAQIPALLADPRLQQVKSIIVGGSPMTEEHERQLAAAHPGVWATYGMTETCSHVALRNVSGRKSYFEALPGISFSGDERNCLIINGSIITNDVVELHSPTRFTWLGRADNVVISGGLKLFPETIEAEMRRADPSLPDFYLTSRGSERWGRELVAVVIGTAAADTTLLERMRCCVANPRHAPKALIYDPQPEFTSSGKLKRRKF